VWQSEHWRDYELIDCGSGERLERWGRYSLVRPDPQAIWQIPRTDPRWRQPDAHYLRSSSGGGRWSKKAVPDRWHIHYDGLTFQVGPMNFKHTGLFPEQAVNWEFCRSQITTAGRPISVLNLFAYTGAASVMCAAAGARVCHVDAAKGMVAWARENAKLSTLADAPIRWIVDDCGKFVQRELRRGHTYDAILMDPPSYGRGPSGEVWKLEEQLWPFLELVVQLLSPEPLFFLINSYTTGLAPSVLTYLLETLIVKRHGGYAESQELGLPVTSTQLSLPCGATGRWVAKKSSI